jgi:hypothetical protein
MCYLTPVHSLYLWCDLECFRMAAKDVKDSQENTEPRMFWVNGSQAYKPPILCAESVMKWELCVGDCSERDRQREQGL